MTQLRPAVRPSSLFARAVGVVVTLCLIATGVPAATASPLFPSNKRDNYLAMAPIFKGRLTELRTRGYYPEDRCIYSSWFCETSGGRFRQEATAQAKVIQTLNASVSAAPMTAPFYSTISPFVQWEVAPGPPSVYPDHTWAPDHDAEEDQEPTESDITNTCPQNDLTGPFRVDVMIDDPAGAKLGIFETKRWVNAETKDDVDDQLDCYVAKARTRRFELARDERLNAQKSGGGFTRPRSWSDVYTDNTGDLWCAWADEDEEEHPGNIYFGRQAELASQIDSGEVPQIPACTSAVRIAAKAYFETYEVVEVAYTLAQAYVIAERLGQLTRETVQDNRPVRRGSLDPCLDETFSAAPTGTESAPREMSPWGRASGCKGGSSGGKGED